MLRKKGVFALRIFAVSILLVCSTLLTTMSSNTGIEVASSREKEQSIIIEVSGDPEKHKLYLERDFPFIEVVQTYDLLFNGLAIKGSYAHLKKNPLP